MALDMNGTARSGSATDEPPSIAEARRQVEICNACRYCEGYCAVFPAITRQTAFAAGDLTQLANLCHNCRGCHYACQYTPPHEFALNLPRALAEVRQESWQRFAWPARIGAAFQTSGTTIALALAASLALIFALVAALPGGGEGFYAALAHGAMVAIFVPAFVFPLAVIAVGLVRYWREVGGAPLRLVEVRAALADAARLRNLSGGQGQGCNFEREERFSDARRHAHQAVMWGFLLCFAATCAGTVMHYLFGWHAPYPWWAPPKLLGVPGGVLLVVGAAGLIWLKTRAERGLGAVDAWGGEVGFTLMLGLTGLTGLMLYAATGTAAVPALLALHLGCVLALFLLMPYSKMAHAPYRLAALARDAQIKQGRDAQIKQGRDAQAKPEGGA